MKLPLDQDVLKNHLQFYEHSCVPMSVELVLKLMKALPIDTFELQRECGNIPKSSRDFDGRKISGINITRKFDDKDRGDFFPLEKLFATIRSEIENGNYVQCACKPNPHNASYHAYVIYGYEGDEFLAITKYYNNDATFYESEMKTKLRDTKGSDILIFHRE
jgi:hypothetical protein